MIYFVKSPDGLVKIGTTGCLPSRLKQLAYKHGVEIEVLGVMDGSYPEERALHKRFADLLAKGKEWFRPGDELLAFIGEHGKPWDKDAAIPERVPFSIVMNRQTLAKFKTLAALDGLFMWQKFERMVSQKFESSGLSLSRSGES